MRDQLNQALQEVIRSPVGFTGTALSALEQLNLLLDSSFSILTFQNPLSGPGFTLVSPTSFPLVEYKPEFEEYIEQHPHRRFYRSHRIDGAVQFTDIITRRRLRNLDLYQAFFKPLGIQHLVAQSYKTDCLEPDEVALPSQGIYTYGRVYSHLSRSTFSMASGRDTRAFSDQDCSLFHQFCKSISLLLQREMRVEAALTDAHATHPANSSLARNPIPPNLQRVIEACDLTLAQSRVLRWLSVGKTNAEVSIILGNSERTIEVHVEAILKKLGVENRVAAAYTVWSGVVS